MKKDNNKCSCGYPLIKRYKGDLIIKECQKCGNYKLSWRNL